MRVAVTGATGFIGRHVLAELMTRDLDIVAVVRPDRAVPGSSAERADAASFDIHRPPTDAFQQMGAPDVVIHLAWGGLPNYKSLHHFEHELPGHYRFLRGLVDAGPRRLLVTGTCFEYGMRSGPLREDMEAAPTNPYGYAKDALRRQLEYLRAAHPFCLIWARLFYMYGEGQGVNSLIPQLERALARGDQVFDMSGGEQLRDYMPVETIARHLVTLALAEENIGVVNICSGKPISVHRLVEDWLCANGRHIRLNLGHYPYPDSEPMAFWGDREKLEGVLGRSKSTLEGALDRDPRVNAACAHLKAPIKGG